MSAESLRTESKDGQRRYRTPTGKRTYPSVTSVIGEAWPSTALTSWRIRQLARAVAASPKEWRRHLKDLMNTRDSVTAGLSMAWMEDEFLDLSNPTHAADDGTMCHTLVERLHHGLPIKGEGTKSQRIRARLAYDAMRDAGVKISAMEIACIRKSLPAYGGTVDVVGVLHDEVVVIDLKFGKQGRGSNGPQIAAYANADEYYLDGQTIHLDVTRGLVLNVDPDENVRWYEVDLHASWRVYKICHELVQVDKRPSQVIKEITAPRKRGTP